jgi:type I restriction enzyme, S subunit
MSAHVATVSNSTIERGSAGVEELAIGDLDVKRFTSDFEVLAEAAGGTKHLKELVLQFAVRGRLCSTTSETADSLLVALERARSRLAKAGTRVADPSSAVTEDEAPYPLPPGWRWVRLRDLGVFLGGGTPAKSKAAFWNGPLPWVSPKDMKRPYIDDAEDHISIEAVEKSAAKLIPTQSVLCVVRGMILAHSFPVAIATRKVAINQDMKALVLAMPELSEFVLRSCQAAKSRVLAKVERSSHGTCRLASEVIETLPIALPPLAEQKRIVAKVDQLMALCDELEARQNKKREVGTRLTKSALEALTTAEGPEEFDAAWKRVVENFDTLFAHAKSIVSLREAVLDFASRGLLVPQIASEGTGASLLEQIVDRRESLVAGSTSAATRAFASSLTLHQIPTSWCWASLEVLTDPVRRITYGILMPGPDRSEGPLYVKVRNMKNGVIDIASLPRTTPEIYAKYARSALRKGDLLMSIRGSYGGIALVPDEIDGANITQDSARIAPLAGINRNFLLLMLRSPLSQRFFASVAKGAAVQGVNIGDIRRMPVALPPLAEQHRIVSQVERLMKMCDQLEVELRRAEQTATKLAASIVAELTA